MCVSVRVREMAVFFTKQKRHVFRECWGGCLLCLRFVAYTEWLQEEERSVTLLLHVRKKKNMELNHIYKYEVESYTSI